MKLSTILAGALVALVSAAPTESPSSLTEPRDAMEQRGAFDAKKLNNLNFKQQDLNYLRKLNNVDLQVFQNLGRNNNFNVLVFQDLFNSNNFNLNSLLQFQQLNTILAIAGTGIFNGIDLAQLNFGALNLGLVGGIGGVNLDQFIEVVNLPQIQTIASQGG